jgi:hypothetical protein
LTNPFSLSRHCIVALGNSSTRLSLSLPLFFCPLTCSLSRRPGTTSALSLSSLALRSFFERRLGILIALSRHSYDLPFSSSLYSLTCINKQLRFVVGFPISRTNIPRLSRIIELAEYKRQAPSKDGYLQTSHPLDQRESGHSSRKRCGSKVPFLIPCCQGSGLIRLPWLFSTTPRGACHTEDQLLTSRTLVATRSPRKDPLLSLLGDRESSSRWQIRSARCTEP